MHRFIKNTVVASLLAVAAVAAQAAPTAGGLYADAGGSRWTYVGAYNIGSGPAWFNSPPVYSAVQAAALLFGEGITYAISTVDFMVDHRAWYDGYGDGTYLPTSNSYGGGQTRAEDFYADVGPAGYNTSGDYSAYVGSDRAALGGGAINYVFASAPAAVPEPASLALVGLALAAAGLGSRRARRARA